jgi:protein-tyrosine phosphatase
LSPFRAVFVCTGNRFRSPLAAAVFRSEAAALGAEVEVESFGLLDLEGSAALPEAVELGMALGVDLASHRSRALEAGVLANADLVVGFERVHVAAAVVDAGAPREASFTLPELVQLLASVPAGQSRPGRELIRTIAAGRNAFGHVPELEDPLGRPYRRQSELAQSVVNQSRTLARRLFAG